MKLHRRKFNICWETVHTLFVLKLWKNSSSNNEYPFPFIIEGNRRRSHSIVSTTCVFVSFWQIYFISFHVTFQTLFLGRDPVFLHLFLFQQRLFQESRKRGKELHLISCQDCQSGVAMAQVIMYVFIFTRSARKGLLFFFLGGNVFAFSVPACLVSSLESCCSTCRHPLQWLDAPAWAAGRLLGGHSESKRDS